MATGDFEPTEDGRRLTISERAVREIVENAVLRLQIKLAETFASAADMVRIQDDLRDAKAAADKRFDGIDAKMAGLETDKAGRDAVTNFKKWLTGGALLATVFMAIQVAISIWLVTRGSPKP